MRRYCLFVLALLALLAGTATSQNFGLEPELPPELLNPVLRLEGDTIRFCYYPDGFTATLDVAIASAIVDSLLLSAEIVPVQGPLSIPGIDFIPISVDDLFIFLTNDCDAFLGFTLAPGIYPEWLTFSRPYVRTGFMALARADGVDAITELVPGKIVGTVMMSEFDVQLASLIASQRPENRWRRFPYPTTSLVVERLFDGTVDVAVGWEPAMLLAIADANTPYSAVSIAGVGSPSRLTGIAMLSNQSYLQTILDSALQELSAAGILNEIYEEVGFPGTVP